MSSLWNSHFASKAASKPRNQIREEKLDVSSILSAVYDKLPQINPGLLRTDQILGRGSMFQVNRGIYQEKKGLEFYVAVKYLRLDHFSKKRYQFLKALLKELAIMMHPALRSHPHIMSPLGYGWTSPNSEDPNPFLMMPYADFGTLSETLQAVRQHRQPSIFEQQNLALDVALGLQTLHENGIIHGDVKADNILLCPRLSALGYSTDVDGIPWTAKVADFGSSLTEKEANEQTSRYTGTALYNAPEIEGFYRHPSYTVSFDNYKKADIFSFGLLVWEVMKAGCFYLDACEDHDILLRQKDYRQYLNNIHNKAGDALLYIALSSLQDAKDEIQDSKAWMAIFDTLKACLKKEAHLRAKMSYVVKQLLRNIGGDRQPVVWSLPRLMSGIPQKPAMVGDFPQNRVNPPISPSFYQFPIYMSERVSPEGLTFRVAPNNKSGKGLQMIPYYRLTSRSVDVISSEEHRSLSLQRAIMSPMPPFEIQQQLVRRWKTLVQEDYDVNIVAEACLELSICYYHGFGVKQDYVESLQFLQKACYSSSIAKAILGRVSAAFRTLRVEDSVAEDNLKNQTLNEANANYFSNRIRSIKSEVVMRRTLTSVQLSLRPNIDRNETRVQAIIHILRTELDSSNIPVETVHLPRLEQLWDDYTLTRSLAVPSLSQRDISAALTEACKMGSFDVAKLLASLCLRYIGGFGEPNPLHWLIMFPPEQARPMAEILICGSGKSVGYFSGVCSHCLNARTYSTAFFPSHCMELLGTPLHWAVRSRNLQLIETLLDLGADVSVRCKLRPQIAGEPPSIARVTYNPLDVAIHYHLYDAVELLLNRTPRTKTSANLQIGTSLIAHITPPFSRFVIHGAYHSLALRETIRILTNENKAFNCLDSFGNVPLVVALTNTTPEQYIILELLQCSPTVQEQDLSKGDNLAILIVLSTETDQPSDAWKLRRIIPFVSDLNACNDSGFNALHYCAILGKTSMADILVSTNRIDINARTNDKYALTALLLAAEFGKTGVVNLLLEAGVHPDLESPKGQTALELAVCNRHYETSSLLIERGASLDFRMHGSVPDSTVLHVACVQVSCRPPMVRKLLTDHPKLRSADILNRVIGASKGFGAKTPLHEAVMFADLDSVQALLEFGADPNFWSCPPDLDPSNRISRVLYKQTPLDLVDSLLRRAATKGLYSEQVKLARQEQVSESNHIILNERLDKDQERRGWELFEGTPQFNFRLEDIQSSKEGQAGVRNFIARLEEIKYMMEEKSANGQQAT